MIPLLIIVCFILLGAVAYMFVKQERLIQAHKDDLVTKMQWAREDALKKSRSTIGGNVTETLAPLIPGFPYNGRDCKQFGSPIDYVIFDGMSQYRDEGTGEITVILCDIKTGNAQLTPVEKEIKAAVEAGRVKWETLRMDLERGGLIPVKHRKKKADPEVDKEPEVE